MASMFLLLITLPALISARIEIDVVASGKDEGSLVTLSGNQMDAISDYERYTYKLTEENLKSAVKNYFGTKPDEAYLRSPTPWGDLYQTYSWPEVSRTLTPNRVQILSVKTEPILVLSKNFNGNNTAVTFKTKIAQDVENVYSSNWQKDGNLSVSRYIQYEFHILGEEKTFGYQSQWGENVNKSDVVTLGSEVEIKLQPNQNVIVEMYATKGNMKIKVDYDASLSGTAAVYYSEGYKGHQFWSLNINSVLNAGGLKNSVASSEEITVSYYTDAKIFVKDASSKQIMYSIPM